MYPALGVSQGLITIEDLPDSLANGQIVKLDEIESINTEAGLMLAYYEDPTELVGNLGYIGIFQEIDNFDSWGTCVDFACGGTAKCLVTDSGNLGGVASDDFADTYTVTIPDFDNVEVVVVRDSLCFWRGETEIIPSPLGDIPVFAYATMWYKGSDRDEYGGGLVPNNKWIVLVDATGGGGGGFAIKDGNQNTPIGTYIPELGSNYIVSE